MSHPSIRPLWKSSNDCSNLCLVLLALKKQHPELHTLPAIIARHTPAFLRPGPAIVLIRSGEGLHWIEEGSGAGSHCILKQLCEHDLMASAPAIGCVAVTMGGHVQLLDLYARASQPRPVNAFTSYFSEKVPDFKSLDFSSSGSYLAVGLRDGELVIIEVEGAKVHCSLQLCGTITSSACSPIGSSLAVGIQGGLLVLIDLEAGEEYGSLRLAHRSSQGQGYIESLVFSRCSTRLAATFRETDPTLSCYQWDLFHVVDVKSGSVIWSRDYSAGSEASWHIDYSPDGSVVAASDEDGAVSLFDAETGEDLLDEGLLGWPSELLILSLAFSTTGSHLAIGTTAGKLFLISMEVVSLPPDRYDGMIVEMHLMEKGLSSYSANVSSGDSWSSSMSRSSGVDNLSFSANGLRLAAATGTTIHILNAETGAQLLTLDLSDQSVILSVDYKFCLPASWAHSQQEGTCTDLEGDPDNDASVIQAVDHPMVDFAEEIPSLEAAETMDELWASAVERRIAAKSAAVEASPAFLLLTFARQTQLLERALMASPLALDATWCVQPAWAGGAKIFSNLEQRVLQAMLPRGQVLKPWHVVVRENDEESLIEAIAHLPESARRLKCGTGRRVMYCEDASSVQADVDAEHMVIEVEVKHTFVHFSGSQDDRSVKTA